MYIPHSHTLTHPHTPSHTLIFTLRIAEHITHPHSHPHSSKPSLTPSLTPSLKHTLTQANPHSHPHLSTPSQPTDSSQVCNHPQSCGYQVAVAMVAFQCWEHPVCCTILDQSTTVDSCVCVCWGEGLCLEAWGPAHSPTCTHTHMYHTTSSMPRIHTCMRGRREEGKFSQQLLYTVGAKSHSFPELKI